MINNYEKELVTEENIEEIREEINCDQADEIKVGDTISTYAIFYQPGNQRGQLTIVHNEGRAGIHFGADSDWGNWSDKKQILTLDENDQQYDINGEEIIDEESEVD